MKTGSIALTVVDPAAGSGRVCRVCSYPAVIGRHRDADVVLADVAERPTLSRKHLVLDSLLPDGALQVTNYSRNGARIGSVWLGHGESAPWRAGEPAWLSPQTRLSFQPEVPFEPEYHSPTSPRWREVLKPDLLYRAWERVLRNGGAHGIDGVVLEEFADRADLELDFLRLDLVTGRYRPLPPRLVTIDKKSGGIRTLHIFTLRDRVLQQAVAMVVGPWLEAGFCPASFAYRPGISAQDAVREIRRNLCQHPWVAESDIADFFPSVGHPRLFSALRPSLSDSRLLELVATLVTAGEEAPGRGLAQGSALSPVLANFFLTPFDRYLSGRDGCLVRYCDDFVILCSTREKAEQALLEAESFLRGQLGLLLKPHKTRVDHIERGFEFLGFRFRGNETSPSESAETRLSAGLRQSAPDRLKQRALLRGWTNYFYPDWRTSPEPAKEREMYKGLATQRSCSDGDLEVELGILHRFRARSDVYARQWAHSDGRRHGFLPCRAQLSPEEINGHVTGEQTLGIYPTLPDGTTQLLVLDVDSRGQQAVRPEAIDLAWEIHRLGRLLGVPLYVEDSGRRGRHVWLFFEKPVETAQANQLGHRILAQAGGVRPGVTCEILPRVRESHHLGSLIKLPFGIHRASKRPSVFLLDEGTPYPSPAEFLRTARALSEEALQRVMVRLSPGHCPDSGGGLEGTGDGIQAVLDRCPLLKTLVQRPSESGQLCHTERLILAYTFGHMGDEGRRFVHQVISGCDNYRASVTEKWLRRVDSNCQPLSCGRLQEWLSELYSDVSCRCSQNECAGRRSPILGARAKRRARRLPRSARPDDVRDDPEWSALENDLFEEGRESLANPLPGSGRPDSASEEPQNPHQ